MEGGGQVHLKEMQILHVATLRVCRMYRVDCCVASAKEGRVKIVFLEMGKDEL